LINVTTVPIGYATLAYDGIVNVLALASLDGCNMVLPESASTNVYAADCELTGTFLNPTASVPSTVQLLYVPEVGVPKTGVVNDGLVERTTFPLPVEVVTPVPPLTTGNAVPDNVIANVPLVVIGEPVTDKNDGTVAATLVTVPLPLLLNVVQSAELNAPRLVADAVGTFKVITGVVVPLATVEPKSVPVVPKVNADTLVTVPVAESLEVIVKLG